MQCDDVTTAESNPVDFRFAIPNPFYSIRVDYSQLYAGSFGTLQAGLSAGECVILSAAHSTEHMNRSISRNKNTATSTAAYLYAVALYIIVTTLRLTHRGVYCLVYI